MRAKETNDFDKKIRPCLGQDIKFTIVQKNRHFVKITMRILLHVLDLDKFMYLWNLSHLSALLCTRKLRIYPHIYERTFIYLSHKFVKDIQQYIIIIMYSCMSYTNL